MEPIRINKYISSIGLCSRREADRLIAEGRVTVEGVKAENGMKVTPESRILVDGKPIKKPSAPVLIAVYKPPGVVTTTAEDEPNNIVTYVGWPERIYPIGRLDKDSEGLLLMTNDGELIDSMMRGSAGHEKEYIVRVKKKISDADLERLRKGVRLKELEVTTRPCKVERLGDHTFRIILTQGLNRQIRRMCKAVGNEVKRLKRVRVLNVELGPMKPGEQRAVTGSELEELYRIAGCRMR